MRESGDGDANLHDAERQGTDRHLRSCVLLSAPGRSPGRDPTTRPPDPAEDDS